MPSALAVWFPDQPFLSIRALNALACSIGLQILAQAILHELEGEKLARVEGPLG